ncbi:hypothetical protein P170DRAFT_357120, partial [Aspergillus steynii IBT 23096]
SIYQSFDVKLPTTPDSKLCFNGQYREFKSNVDSTVDAAAVPVYIKDDNSVFRGIADIYLPLLRPFSTLSDKLPRLKASHRLNTESDASYFTTLDPMAPAGLAVVCSSERQGGPRSRFDVQWALYSEVQQLLTTLAILEVKNTHIVHKKDFLLAEVTPAQYEERMEATMGLAPLFTYNATWLSKQARKYSDDCADVAVFDWNAMFVCNYALLSLPGKHGIVRGTYFDVPSLV